MAINVFRPKRILLVFEKFGKVGFWFFEFKINYLVIVI